MKKKRAFIVDDEPLAVQEMMWMLQEFNSIEIIGHAHSAAEAIQRINTSKPDLIFLDIHIPEKNGFQIVNELSYFPQIIFVTAYYEYALKAFEINAVDYLMKPVGQDRLIKALARVDVNLPLATNKIFIKDEDEMKFLEIHSIYWIESIGNYIRIHHEGGSNMLYKSLTAIEEQLSNQYFFRANRRELFNQEKVEIAIRKEDVWSVKLINGKELLLSQRQSAKFSAIYKHIES